LESHLPFRLILYWIRLRFALPVFLNYSKGRLIAGDLFSIR
jgi:hypothetical protein